MVLGPSGEIISDNLCESEGHSVDDDAKILTYCTNEALDGIFGRYRPHDPSLANLPFSF